MESEWFSTHLHSHRIELVSITQNTWLALFSFVCKMFAPNRSTCPMQCCTSVRTVLLASSFAFQNKWSKPNIKMVGFVAFGNYIKLMLYFIYILYQGYPLPPSPPPSHTSVIWNRAIFLLGKLRSFVEIRFLSVKGCSHGLIASAIHFSQLMGCMGFSVVVAITPCEHLHWILHNLFVAIKKSLSQSHCVKSFLA